MFLILISLLVPVFGAEAKFRSSGLTHVHRVISKDLFAAPVKFNLQQGSEILADCVRALTDPKIPSMSWLGSEPRFDRPFRRGIQMARGYARALVETESQFEVVYFIPKLGWPDGSSGLLVDAKSRAIHSFLGIHSGISGIPDQSATAVDPWWARTFALTLKNQIERAWYQGMGPSVRQTINLLLLSYAEEPYSRKAEGLRFDLAKIRGDAKYPLRLSEGRSWLEVYGYDRQQDGLRHSAGRFGGVMLILDMKSEGIPYDWIFQRQFFDEMRPARVANGSLGVRVILYWDSNRMIELANHGHFRSVFWHEPITYE